MVPRSIFVWAIVAVAASALVITDCDVARTNCEGAPDSNKAACAALWADCSAGATSSVATLAPPASIPTPVSSPAPSTDCDKARSDCKAKPEANQAYCAAQYAQCTASTSTLKTLIPPTAISALVPTTSALSPTATDCEKDKNDCKIKPEANQAECAAKYAQCTASTSTLQTLIPPTAISPPGPVVTNCEQARVDCASKPESNKANCAALYAQCAASTLGVSAPGSNITSVDITVYTTICPVTATSDGSTYVYTTTSTITSCNGGCPATLATGGAPASPEPTLGGNSTLSFTGAGYSFGPGFGLLSLAVLIVLV